MSLPNLSGTARLYKDVDLRFSPSGMAIAKVPLVFNARKKDDAGNWVDGDSFFVTGLLFKERAEEAAERLVRGAEVMVTGRLKTNSWEDKEGNKRSTTELIVDSIGETVREVLKKASRSGGGGGFGQGAPSGGGQGGQRDTYGGQGGNQPTDDPWATGPATNDDPPF